MHGPRAADGEPAPPAQGRAFGALRHSDFRYFWGGSIISQIGAWMQNVAQAWLVYQLTESAFFVGLNGLFHGIPFILMSLYAGTVVDRVDRRKLLICVEGFNTAVVIVIGTLVLTGNIQVWQIYLSSVCYSLAGGFESPARNALLPHLVPRADLMTAISLNSTTRKGAQIIGPALGGVFVATFGVAGAYFINSLGFGVLMWCLFKMRATNPPTTHVHPNPLRSIQEGIQYVRGFPLVAVLLLMEATMSVFGSYMAMMVVFARQVFETGPAGLGLLQSAGGLGSVTGSFILASAGDVHRKGRLLVIIGVVYSAALIAFAFSPSFLVALPLLALVGGSDVVFGATRSTILQLVTRSEMLGRVMSLSAISMRGLGNLGNFQTGLLATVIGVQPALALGGLLCAVFTLGAAWRFPIIWRFVGAGGDLVEPPKERSAPHGGLPAAPTGVEREQAPSHA